MLCMYWGEVVYVVYIWLLEVTWGWLGESMRVQGTPQGCPVVAQVLESARERVYGPVWVVILCIK